MGNRTYKRGDFIFNLDESIDNFIIVKNGTFLE